VLSGGEVGVREHGLRIVVHVFVALGLTVLVMQLLPRLVMYALAYVSSFASMLEESAFLSVPVELAARLGGALVFVRVLGQGDWASCGFKAKGNLMIRQAFIVGLVVAFAMPFVLSLVIIAGGLDPMGPFIEFPSVLHHILIGLIFASVTEEIVFRGLVQSYLSVHISGFLVLFKRQLTLPALAGATFFAVGHLSLLTLGVALPQVVAIILGAFILGIAAGYFRDKTGSLVGPIIIHMLGNAPGILAYLGQ